MKTSKIPTMFFLLGMALLITLASPVAARAHCDTLDGSVVIDAKTALVKSDVMPVLEWVRKENEGEIRAAFEKTLAVRKLNAKGKNPQAQELANIYFFEALVQLHRAGEGAPYIDLKSAGADLGPAVKGADAALDSGSIDTTVKLVNDEVAKGIRARFVKVRGARKHMNDSIEAGREYVEAYVEYVPYVEGLFVRAEGNAAHYKLAAEPANEHHQE